MFMLTPDFVSIDCFKKITGEEEYFNRYGRTLLNLFKEVVQIKSTVSNINWKAKRRTKNPNNWTDQELVDLQNVSKYKSENGECFFISKSLRKLQVLDFETEVKSLTGKYFLDKISVGFSTSSDTSYKTTNSKPISW